jgi:Lipopolysaccharide assembly protein A domain
MWRLLTMIFTLALVCGGIYAGVFFVDANPAIVNVQFPGFARESGEIRMGVALLAAMGVGIVFALVLAMFNALAMTLNMARLKREIRSLRREVDALRNLPLFEEELDRDPDGDEVDSFDDTGSELEVAAGPVRSGSTVAPVEDDDDRSGDLDDQEGAEDDEDEDDAADPASTRLSGGTRKIDSP